MAKTFYQQVRDMVGEPATLPDEPNHAPPVPRSETKEKHVYPEWLRNNVAKERQKREEARRAKLDEISSNENAPHRIAARRWNQQVKRHFAIGSVDDD